MREQRVETKSSFKNARNRLRIFEFSVLSTCIYIFPLIILDNQLLLGTIVNFLLYLTSQKLERKTGIIFVAAIPSLSVLSRGLLFGSLTYVVGLMVPFIVTGNIFFIFITSPTVKPERENTPNRNNAIYDILAVIGKSGVIMIGCIIFLTFNLFPQVLLPNFSYMQVITASLGIATARIIQRIGKKVYHALSNF